MMDSDRRARLLAAKREIAELGNGGRRSVEEWIGAHPDSAIPKRVKLRVLLRYGGKCHRSGHKFRPGDRIEFDHVVALANGGAHRESNLAPILGGKVHQAKTAEDVAIKSKIDRIRAKHAGLWPQPRNKLRGRGFTKGRNKAASEAPSD